MKTILLLRPVTSVVREVWTPERSPQVTLGVVGHPVAWRLRIASTLAAIFTKKVSSPPEILTLGKPHNDEFPYSMHQGNSDICVAAHLKDILIHLDVCFEWSGK